MSNREFREKEQRSPLDKLGNVAGAALAIGAGAALFYRGGLNKYLSDDYLSGVRKAALDVSNDLTNKKINSQKINIDDVKRYYSNTKETLRTRTNKLVIDADNENNLFNIIKRRSELLENKKPFANKIYNNNEIIQPLISKYVNKNTSEVDARAINNLITDATENIENYVAFKDNNVNILNHKNLKRQLDGTTVNIEQQEQIIEDVLNKLHVKENSFDSWMDKNTEVIDSIANKLTDIDGLKKKFGTVADTSLGDSILQGTIDKKATLGEVLNSSIEKDSKYVISTYKDNKSGTKEVDIIQETLKFLDTLDDNTRREYENLYVGDTIRKNIDNQLYSTTIAGKVKKDIEEEAANTIPGKILKLRDISYAKNQTNLHLFTGGKFDAILANTEGKNKTTIDGNYVRILDKTYKINDDKLSHMPEMDNTYLMSGMHGSTTRILRSMSGDMDKVESKNSILKWLDIGTSAESNKLEELHSRFSKFKDPDWLPNIKKILNSGNDIVDDENEYLISYMNKVEKINKAFNNSSNVISRESAIKLSNSAPIGAKDYFELLTKSDDDLVNSLMETYHVNDKAQKFLNADMYALIRGLASNSTEAKKSKSILSNKIDFSGAHSLNYIDKLKREIFKEGMLNVRNSYNHKNMSMFEMIEKAGIEGAEKINAEKLSAWSILQQASGTFSTKLNKANNIIDINEARRRTNNVKNLFNGKYSDFNIDDSFKYKFNEVVDNVIQDNSSIFQKGNVDKEIIRQSKSAEYVHINKAIKPTDILRSTNEDVKAKAFLKQFVAGKDSMDNVTTATLAPYFMLFRLTESLNGYGIGLSSSNAKNSLDLAKNIMLKRVAPIMIGLTAFDYLNDESQDIFGTGITGSFANAKASVDLGARKIVDTFGLTNYMKDRRDTYVTSQYLNNNDSEEYQSHEERLRWYSEGYTAVRKSRWWSFGSTSEFKGGKIAYFEPNYLRKAHSDYYDVSMYGSNDEKWKHSWLPTPASPLAPLRKILDPYWLEREHYWDRPYMYTGKMFGEGYPWSGALNATVGQILKPQRRMHRKEVGNGLVDIRSIIEANNRQIIDKAIDNDYISIENNNVSSVNYNPYFIDGSEITNQYTLSANGITNKNLNTYASMQASDIGDVDEHLSNMFLETEGSGIFVGTPDAPAPSSYNKSNVTNKFAINVKSAMAKGNIVGEILHNTLSDSGLMALNEIYNINSNIILSAKAKQAALMPDTLNSTANQTIGTISDDTVASDLRNVTSTKEMLSDIAYSTKQLSGMYGFIFDEIMPNQKRHRLESATRMNSFQRKFWDANIGGVGGEFMEIARRFFPHENHNIEEINPIRNTMPEWMPERYRTGDPYGKLPKGEMRLPGKGYEEMYKLHPDQFGMYGAYDRMKILADVAPWSSEYKQWREIASKTIKDKKLRDNMEDIKDRVDRQSKNHEFYDYRFKEDLDSKHATIETVVSKNAFTIVGDNTVYRLAGVEATNKETLSKYLEAGMKIQLQTEKNSYSNDDGSVNAIVKYKNENLNRELYRSEDGVRNDDGSAISTQARLTEHQRLMGGINELIAHADIPFLHSKFMRVENAYESYQRNHIYGAEYSTWSNPIATMLKPSWDRAISASVGMQAIGFGALKLSEYAKQKGASKSIQALADSAWALSNKGAFMGGTIATILRGGTQYTRLGATIGSYAGLAGAAYVNIDNPLMSALSFGAIGAKSAEFFKTTNKQGAAIGAAIGLGLSALKNPDFDYRRMFNKWIPDETKKQWEIEEYYDRLKYVKYMGLYQKAADLAKSKEGVDIEKLLNSSEYKKQKDKKYKADIEEKIKDVSNNYSGQDKDKLLKALQSELYSSTNERVLLKAGEYTKAALAYKQAADSTIYGLKEDATWSEILRALPKQKRDYFMEFGKVKDEKERKKIMKLLSPYEQKVMNVLWKTGDYKVESNSEYFESKFMPGTFWSGWRPDVDLDDVEMKTIKNEGMQLADFGFYESQYNNSKEVPSIDPEQSNYGMLNMRKNLISALNGAGLLGVDVSIQESETSGFQVIANIARSTSYNIQNSILNIF